VISALCIKRTNVRGRDVRSKFNFVIVSLAALLLQFEVAFADTGLSAKSADASRVGVNNLYNKEQASFSAGEFGVVFRSVRMRTLPPTAGKKVWQFNAGKVVAFVCGDYLHWWNFCVGETLSFGANTWRNPCHRCDLDQNTRDLSRIVHVKTPPDMCIGEFGRDRLAIAVLNVDEKVRSQRLFGDFVGFDSSLCGFPCLYECVAQDVYSPNTYTSRNHRKNGHQPLSVSVSPRSKIILAGYEMRDIGILTFLYVLGVVLSICVVGWLTKPSADNDANNDDR
jgi:hypothetical protein